MRRSTRATMALHLLCLSSHTGSLRIRAAGITICVSLPSRYDHLLYLNKYRRRAYSSLTLFSFNKAAGAASVVAISTYRFSYVNNTAIAYRGISANGCAACSLAPAV